MILLLPPSERKAPGGGPAWRCDSGRFGGVLREPRTQIVKAFGDESLPLPTGSKRPDLATLPAYQRYTGVVWQYLDPLSMDEATLTRAENSALIVSAQGGLFGWSDPVPDYKLKMSARLWEVGKLSRYWRPHLQNLLTGEHFGMDDPLLVIDLLALEQSEAIQAPERTLAGSTRWLRVELLGPNGERSGHNGKAAKGRLSRALLEHHDPEMVLHTWQDDEGWLLKIS